MTVLLYVGLFVASVVITLAGCHLFTNGIEWLGKRLNISEGAVGSVFAAVGTTLPETSIPIIAIFFGAGREQMEVGLGAILGAPFMLSTLVLPILALLLVLYMTALGVAVGVRDAGVDVRLGCGVTDLIVDEDHVTGVTLDDGSSLTASRGVILCSGGFDHNPALRKRFHRSPAGPELSLGATSNTGEPIIAAESIGAATDLMDDAWWAPSIPLPNGPWFALAERSLPRSIIVNNRGVRFMNESLPYVEATHAMFGGPHGSSEGPAENLPAWLIFDQGYRDRYMFAGRTARSPLPRRWFDEGYLVRADSITELAHQLSLPEGALEHTLDRFNDAARRGVRAEISSSSIGRRNRRRRPV